MLPHSEGLTLPLKEGIRDLRSSIRLEARAGSVSGHLFGLAGPSRRLARLADGVLTRAERVAREVLTRESEELGGALDRLAASLGSGVQGRSADTYAVCRALLDREGVAGLLVSELALAQGRAARVSRSSDPMLDAARAAGALLGSGAIRPCLSTVLLPETARSATAERVAIGCWLAVLVRREGDAPAPTVIESVHRVLDAEGEDWARLLRDGRFEALAEAWRRTVPYLP